MLDTPLEGNAKKEILGDGKENTFYSRCCRPVAIPRISGLLVKSRFFANNSCSKNAPRFPVVIPVELVPWKQELAQALNVLTAYTLRTLYSY